MHDQVLSDLDNVDCYFHKDILWLVNKYDVPRVEKYLDDHPEYYFQYKVIE